MEEKFTNEEKEVIKKHFEFGRNLKFKVEHMDKVLSGDEQAKWEEAVYSRFIKWRKEDGLLEDEINSKLYSNTNNLNQARELLNKFRSGNNF